MASMSKVFSDGKSQGSPWKNAPGPCGPARIRVVSTDGRRNLPPNLSSVWAKKTCIATRGESLWRGDNTGMSTMKTIQQDQSTPSSVKAKQGSPTILLVEDVDQLRALVSTLLRNAAYTVLEAEDGKACSKLIQEYPGPIHLLLADIFLPGMNGRKVADHLHTLRKETKILFMSGRSNEEIFGHAGLYPGAGFLAKPFTPETLLRKVAETLGA